MHLLKHTCAQRKLSLDSRRNFTSTFIEFTWSATNAVNSVTSSTYFCDLIWAWRGFTVIHYSNSYQLMNLCSQHSSQRTYNELLWGDYTILTNCPPDQDQASAKVCQSCEGSWIQGLWHSCGRRVPGTSYWNPQGKEIVPWMHWRRRRPWFHGCLSSYR